MPDTTRQAATEESERERASDASLVAAALRGELDAFDRLMCRYQHHAFGWAFRWLGRFADAQDVAQEALIEAYLHLGSLQEPARFGGWLRGIISNLCRNQLRGRREECALAEDAVDEVFRQRPPETEDEFSLRTALAGLKEQKREALILHYVDGLSYREVADFLGVPVSTVKWRIHDGKRRIRKELLGEVKRTLRQGNRSEEITPRITELLKLVGTREEDVPTAEVSAAAKELIAFGRPAFTAMIRALDSSQDVVLRQRVVFWLRFDPSPRARDALIRATRDSNRRVRVSALHNLLRRSGKVVADAALARLGDHSKHVRAKAADVLGVLRDRRALAPVAALLNDSEAKVQRHALWALKEIAGGDSTTDTRSARSRKARGPDIGPRAAHSITSR